MLLFEDFFPGKSWPEREIPEGHPKEIKKKVGIVAVFYW